MDDFEDLLFIACKFLEKQAPDIELVTCESANEALKKLEEEDFDIIVSDYQMPVMDGLEFLETIRKTGNEIPFIIFTGRGREEVAIQALNLGATHYLKKGGEQKSQFAELAHHIRTAVSHRQSEVALQESEGKYRSLFDDAAVSLWDEDFSDVKKFFEEKRAEGVTDFRAHFEKHPEDVEKCVGLVIITDVNNASIIGQGVSNKQDLVGPLERVFRKDALDVFKEELISLAEGNTLFKSEVHLIKDVAGEEHAFIFHLNVPPGYEDSLAKVYLSIIDVTGRYQSELLAERESERAQTYLELSPVMFVALDANGSINFVNSHTCKIMGYDEKELIGNDWFALAIPETMKEEVKGAFNAIMEGRLEAVRYFETPIQTKDGEERIIAWSNTYLTDESGTINGVLSSGEDITDRKLMDEALKNREGQLKSVFDESPISLGYYDSEGKMIDANIRYLELFGIESVEAFQEYRMHSHFLKYIKENLETQESFIWEFEYDFDAVVAEGYPMTRTGKVDLEIHSSRIPIIGHTKDGYLMQVIETTERKKIMERLKTSEERYRLVLGSMNDPIFVFDRDNCYREIYASKENQPLYPEEEMLGKHISEIIPAHNLEPYLELLTTVRETSIPQTFEYSYIREGKEEWYISTLTLHEDGESVVSVSRKVTDMVKAQQTVRESEEKYRTIVQSMSDIIFVHDKNDYYTEVYVSNEIFLSGSKSSFIGHHPSENSPPELLSTFQVASSKVRSTGEPESFDYSIILNDEEKWFTTTLSLHEDGESIVSVVREITEKKLAENALRESESRFKTVVEASFDGIFIHADGKILEANQRLADMLEYSKESLIGKRPLDLVTEESKGIIAKYGELGVASKIFLDMIRNNGSIARVESVAMPCEYQGKDARIVAIRDITNEVEARKDLETSEAQKESILRVAPVGIGVVTNRVFTYVSDSFVHMIGYSRDELLGKNARMIYPSDDEYLRVGTQKYEQIEKYGTGSMDTQFLCKDGKIIDVDMRSTAIDLNDLEKGVTFTALDISTRIRDARAISENEEKYRLLIDSMEQGILILQGSPTKVVYSNIAIEKMTGYSPDELVALEAGCFLEIFHPEKSNSSLDLIQKFLDNCATSPEEGIEHNIRHKDGRMLWLLGHLKQILYRGKPACRQIFVDITQRKLTEDELHTSEEMFRVVTGSMKEGILVVDQERNVRYTNKVYETMWRIPEEIMASKDDVKILEYVLDQLPDPLNYLEKVGELYNSQGQSYNTILLKDGRVFDRYSFPIMLEKEVKGRAWIFRDISDEVSVDAKIKQEREALSNFAHRMSHELKNTLLAIGGHAGLLEDEHSQESIDAIKTLVEKASKLMSRSVLLADAGLVIGQMSTHSLDDIIEDALSEMMLEEIKVKKDVLPTLKCDRMKVTQVIRNILQNAIEHGDAKKIEILVQENTEGSYILFKNDGTPIPDDYHKKIFKEGFTTKKSGGIGLGIVKKIVEAHGWTITLDKGVPTCFRIFIPISSLN